MDTFNFDDMNETDVREEIIAPLLRRLGYRSGTPNNVRREQSLRYPRMFLGRKDVKRDPELRGKADYIVEVEERLRWVIEAKSPAAEISRDDVEQAWSYANHPEVRSIYFALCNGKILTVFRTVDGPQGPAVMTLTFDSFDTDYKILECLLSPEALQRDFPDISPEIGIPIAPGLRSISRITGGIIRYDESSLGLHAVTEQQTWISNGAIERDEDGKLVIFANISPVSVFTNAIC